jgi:hypothetical protein
MAIQNNLNATLSLNTSAGTNQPAPVDTYNSTATFGTLAAGPIQVSLTSTSPVAIPLASTPASGVYGLLIAHNGISTDPQVVIDMQNGAANSSKLTLLPGGRLYLYNGILAVSGATYSDWANWKLMLASGGSTIVSVSIVYT